METSPPLLMKVHIDDLIWREKVRLENIDWIGRGEREREREREMRL